MLSADIEAHGHTEGCPGCARKSKDECIQRQNRHDRASERERKQTRVEQGAGDVPMEPGTEEQMADRHAVASGEEEKQHEENERGPHLQKRIGDSK